MKKDIQIARITSGTILVYGLAAETHKRSKAQEENEINLRDNKYNGFMSPKTRSKVRKYLDTWITGVEAERRRRKQGRYFRNGKLTFITLTLSAKQVHEDNYVKRHMLGRFMIRLQRQYHVRNYFWRAESQENGNIHFHILADRFIDWQLIRQEWNGIQADYGYIDRFEAAYGHRDPNSTDIHGLEKITNVTAYVVKYCCKVEGYRPIAGRIWGCSDSIRGLVGFEQDCTPQVMNYIRKAQNDASAKTVVMEEYTLIFCDNNELLQRYDTDLHARWCRYYESIYQDLYIKEVITLEKTKIPKEPMYTATAERQALSVQLDLFQNKQTLFSQNW